MLVGERPAPDGAAWPLRPARSSPRLQNPAVGTACADIIRTYEIDGFRVDTLVPRPEGNTLIVVEVR